MLPLIDAELASEHELIRKQLGLINKALTEGLICCYQATVFGIAVWDPFNASKFKSRHDPGVLVDDFVNGYGKEDNCERIDELDLPDGLKQLKGKGFKFLRSKSHGCHDAVFIDRNGKKITNIDEKAAYIIPLVAFLDYCGLANHPLFQPINKAKPRASKKREKFSIEKLERRFLEYLESSRVGEDGGWRSNTELRKNIRDRLTHEQRKSYGETLQRLISQGKISVRVSGHNSIRYRIFRPGDSLSKSSVIDVVAQAVPDSAQLAPPPVAKPSNALAVQESLIEKRFRQVFQNNPDMSCFLHIVTGALQAIGIQVLWVEFEGRQWVTIRQAGELLGLDERTIKDHLLKSPFEMSILSDKLTGQRLNAYKQLCPPTPEARRFDRRASGVGAENDWSASEFASHFILVSPAGLAWLASKSETGPAKAIMQTDWIIKAELPGQIEKAMTHVADSAKTLAGQHATSTDLAQFGLNEVMQGLGFNNGRLTVDLRDPAKDHILRNVMPPILKINHFLGSYKIGLHPLMGCTGDFIWHQWDKKNPYRRANPVIYMIFADVFGKGFHTHLVSIGKGSSEVSARVSRSHERIQVVSNMCSGRYDVFILDLLEPKYRDEATLLNLEGDLRSELKPIWDSLIDTAIRQEWRNAVPDTGQGNLFSSET